MIPTIAQIIGAHQPDTRPDNTIGAHQPDTRPDNTIDGCIACPDTTHNTWEAHATHIQNTVAATYRIDVLSDLQSLPEDTLVIDVAGNIIELPPIDGEVEVPVWILPRIDQNDSESPR